MPWVYCSELICNRGGSGGGHATGIEKLSRNLISSQIRCVVEVLHLNPRTGPVSPRGVVRDGAQDISNASISIAGVLGIAWIVRTTRSWEVFRIGRDDRSAFLSPVQRTIGLCD